MQQYVNLQKIVYYIFEDQIEAEPDESAKEYKRKSIYEKTRADLIKVFRRIEFVEELIKGGEKGIGEKGEYRILKSDGPIMEWIISILNEDFGRKIKAEKFSQCRQEEIRKLVDGLIQIVRNLEVDEDTVLLQKKIMEQKTMIYINEEFEKMGDRIYRSMHAFGNMIPIDTNSLSYEESCEFLEDVREGLNDYLNKMEHEYTIRCEKKRKELYETAPKLTKEDMKLSERSQMIAKILDDNAEFICLKEEYDTLFKPIEKPTASHVLKVEKRKKEIIKRQYEIFDEITKDYPRDIEKMTTIEKYLVLSGDEGIRLHYDQANECFVLLPVENYFAQDWIKRNTHPFDDE